MIDINKPLRVIFLGPPASGKGTQADKFTAYFHRPHISTGDILREIKDDPGHPMSSTVSDYVKRGVLVPTELVNSLVAEKIAKAECQPGFVLDGYPRRLDQAVYLDSITQVTLVFAIEVSNPTVIERMSGRRSCANKHICHLKFSPPRNQSVCDICGLPLVQRDDDKPETIANRLEIYYRETDAIVNYYAGQGKLVRIDGEKDVEEVFGQIVAEMEKRGLK